MPKSTRRFGDRKDGRRVRNLDALHIFIPYMLKNRTDCEAFISEQIDLTAITAYLSQKNRKQEDKYSIFHVIAAAMVKTIVLRPRLNRFIAGRRFYERDTISLAFVAKNHFHDDGGESLLFLSFGQDATIDMIHDQILQEVGKVRSGAVDNTTHFMDKLGKLPRCILRILTGFLQVLDFYGKVPDFLIKEDPNYASVFISNLGSIQLNAAYHHLNNWGTNSAFVVIGEKHKKPVFDENGDYEMREVLNIGITLDERIADGYYYAKSVKLLKHLLLHPELLEKPAKELVKYE